MANSRMAGEALSNAERHRQKREEIGNNSERLAERISGVDREKYDFDGYTDKQINMAFQGSSFGDGDYARLTGNSADSGKDDKDGGDKTKVPSPESSSPPGETDSSPTYGGDNKSFIYNASGKKGSSKYEDTPVSSATMAGFYAPDDSPAAQAKFNAVHSSINAEKQKRYAGDAMNVVNKYKYDARDYTNESMENYLNRSIQYSYDRADRQTGATFGDIWNPNYITENWQMPDAPKEIESNASEIAKDAKDDIEDI